MTKVSTLSMTVSATPVSTLRAEVVKGPDAGLGATALTERLSIGTEPGNTVRVTDPTVSSFHVELTRLDDGILVSDLESKNGTIAGGVRIREGIVSADAALHLGGTQVRILEGDPSTVQLLDGDVIGGLYGKSEIMRRLMARLQSAAGSDASVLIIGESGTGKELIARALHDESARANKPFVTVDCAGLPRTLVTSELFGHERGAFTGADKRYIGAFERASGGTIFLDELGELPIDVQSNLLGVLERKRFRRVGGRDEIEVDVRVVAATNRDLRREVNHEKFRLDLYHRVAVVTLDAPPLRARADDIPLLVEHFMRACGFSGPIDELMAPSAMKSLAVHRWPGNVRELRNLIEATVALGETPPFQDAPSRADGADAVDQVLSLPYRQARRDLLDEFEYRYLTKLLARANGNLAQAARIAKMDRSYLSHMVRRHDLEPS